MNKYEKALLTVALKRGWTVTGAYTNAITKTEMKCTKGHTVFITPMHFKQGKGCAVCSGKCPKAAKELFKALVISRGYELLGDYVTSVKKVAMVCPKDHSFFITPSSFKQSHGCPVCGGRNSATAREKFLKFVAERGYSVIGDYVNNCTKVTMCCPESHYYEQTPHNFNSNHGCPSCANYGYDSGKCGYLYILRHECNNYYKVGISNQPKRRLKRLRKTTPFDFEIIGIFKGDGKYVYETEQTIHKTFPSANLKSFDGATEWVVATGDIINLPEIIGLTPFNY